MKEWLKELRLYNDKDEFLIKASIWAICWLGGIYAAVNTQDQRALASAYLIFSLSLLMEFGTRTKQLNQLFSRIVISLFILSMVALLIMAISALFEALFCDSHYKIMFIISLCIIAFLEGDFIFAWLGPDYEINVPLPNTDSSANETATKEFEDRLQSGALGKIKKRDKDE